MLEICGSARDFGDLNMFFVGGICLEIQMSSETLMMRRLKKTCLNDLGFLRCDVAH